MPRSYIAALTDRCLPAPFLIALPNVHILTFFDRPSLYLCLERRPQNIRRSASGRWKTDLPPALKVCASTFEGFHSRWPDRLERHRDPRYDLNSKPFLDVWLEPHRCNCRSGRIVQSWIVRYHSSNLAHFPRAIN